MQEKGSRFLFQSLQSFTLESHISKDLSETWPMLTGNIGVSHIPHQKYHGNETMSTVSSHLFFHHSGVFCKYLLCAAGSWRTVSAVSSLS